jgi:hypothetical protein
LKGGGHRKDGAGALEESLPEGRKEMGISVWGDARKSLIASDIVPEANSPVLSVTLDFIGIEFDGFCEIVGDREYRTVATMSMKSTAIVRKGMKGDSMGCSSLAGSFVEGASKHYELGSSRHMRRLTPTGEVSKELCAVFGKSACV